MSKSAKISLITFVLTISLAGSTVAQPYLLGDLDGNYRVDFKDLRTFAWQWLDPDCLFPGCIADLDDVDGVNMADFALLAKDWQIEEPPIVISEFMASNASNLPLEEGELLDGDGQSSDWIEIYNPTDTTVNLNGWYLTDNGANLTLWQFPDGLQIEAGEFLVVFASGKTYEENPLNYPYLDSLDYYHTNFELDKDLGEYLALVAPDGNTIVHEYAPEFPCQLTDISYGLAQYATTLVPISAIASYHVPTSGDVVLDTDWTNPDFNDLEWDTGETGIGFGLGGERMVAYNDCVYRSSDQDIADNVTTYGIGNGYTGLTSGPLVDQVTGDDMGITVMLTQSGGVTWKPDPDAGGSDCAIGTDAYDTFGGTADMTGVIYYGGAGWWIDLTFTGLDPTIKYTFATSANRGNPSYTNRRTIYTLTGADTYTNVSTSGVDVLAENKVRFNTGDNYNQGYVARWTGITAAAESFTVRAEADPSSDEGRKAYSFDVFMLEGGSRVTDIRDDMLGVNASLWMRTEFNLEEGEPEIFDTLTLRMKYEDGFVAYLNGQPVTSRNAPNSVEWDSTALSDRPIEDSLVFEEINLMAFVNTLQTGRNVLAIHGLNDDAADPNFLILPELVAASNMSVPQYFERPTPESFNIPGAMGIVSKVWFSHERGFYDTGFQLVLSTAMEDAEIRYTVDGSCPTITHGITYAGPFDVNQTTTVRAVAVKPGWLPANVDAHTYVFLFDVANQPAFPPGFPTSWAGYTADYEVDPDVVNTTLPGYSFEEALLWIPSISITMPSDDLFGAADGIYVYSTSKGDQWERPASIELIYPDGRDGFQINAGTHLHGGSSRIHSRTLKHSFRLVFRGIYGSTKLNFPLFPDSDVERFDQLVLRASSGDSWSYPDEYHHEAPEHIKEQAQYTRDPWMKDTQRAMGHHSAHSIFVHLYLNGLYWGQYNLCERVNNSFQASYYGGDKEEYDVIHDREELQSGSMDVWNQMFDLCTAGLASDEDAQFIQGNNPDGTRNPDYPIILNVDSLIDYMIIHIYARVDDWPCHNFWAARRRGPLSEGFRFFVWDQENHTNALNRLITGCGVHLEILPDEVSTTILPAYPYARLRDNPMFRRRYSDRIHKLMFNGGLLTPEKVEERWMKRATEIDKSVVAESARWGDAQLDDPPRDDPYKREVEWLDTQNWIRTVYWPQIGDIVLERYRGVGLYPDIHAPVFRINDVYQHGGQASSGDELTMDNPNGSGTIYYTIDGSDPREPLTGNPIGTPYAPFMLNKSTHVKARVLDGTWSALNEAIFAIGPLVENLRITEIMYHPRNTGDANDPNEEFIELKNIGHDTLNLNLVRFTEGIDFTFPDMELDPNECVVIVKDQSAFIAQYGPAVNMTGQYTGRLANNGERIKLVDAIGRTILDFEYEDGWRLITDGDGFSLTVIEPTNSDVNSWSEKNSWRSSVYRNGTPGWDDSGILPNPGAVVINEVMAHSNTGPDWIELHNTTNDTINIGGWFLSDNNRDEPNLMKYRIADGTTIDSNDYLVFYQEADFNNPGDPGCLVPFGLSENGEEACLSSRLDPNGYLTGYRQVENFGASQTNVSLGRYYKPSTDNFNFVAMDYNTPDVNNAYPKVGPVVINEIMYNPPTGNQNEEYIELHNITGALVTLYRYDKSTSWKFTDGIDYTFNPSPPVTIPAYGYLILARDLTVFTARYGGMPPGVQVLDGYSGWLSNAGERLQIGMPGDTDDLDVRQYIRIDRVTYSDGSHPEDCPGGVDYWSFMADGFGFSLSRRVPSNYGNDVANWQGAAPSPGTANP